MSLKSRAYIYLGKIRSHNQKYEKAIRTFQDGVNVCGDIGRLYYFMANNYASLGKYNEAIENWNKALSTIDRNDFEMMIKIYVRFLYSQEYHQKNSKKIHELFFKLIDLIQNNYLISEYKEIYCKLISDFSSYKQTNNCAQMFSFKTPRANGEITDDMIDRLNGIYKIFKDTYFKESSLDVVIVKNNEE
jgi:tetratricopeptide (TPR) repeat protein